MNKLINKLNNLRIKKSDGHDHQSILTLLYDYAEEHNTSVPSDLTVKSTQRRVRELDWAIVTGFQFQSHTARNEWFVPVV